MGGRIAALLCFLAYEFPMRTEDLPEIGIEGVDDIVYAIPSLDRFRPKCSPSLLHGELRMVEAQGDEEESRHPTVTESGDGPIEDTVLGSFQELILLDGLPGGIYHVPAFTG